MGRSRQRTSNAGDRVIPAHDKPLQDRSALGRRVSVVATEAYQVTTIMTIGIGSGGVTDRATMRAFLDDQWATVRSDGTAGMPPENSSTRKLTAYEVE